MDDRELEARLRDRLHARFDAAQPSGELGASVAQVLATQPRLMGWTSLRSRQLQLGWPVVAVVAVAAIAIVAANVWRPTGPGITHESPKPSATTPSSRTFVVMSRSTDSLSKADTGLASDVLAARLSALGFGNFSSYAGYGIVFSLPADGPSDGPVRAVLRATGDVAFVPLPADDYGSGGLVAEVGKPLPKAEPSLFGWEGIESATRDATEAAPTVKVTLKPLAAQAFADYTAAHVGEQFAILVDGIVAVVPIVNAPIPGGEVTISAGVDNADPFAQTVAILAGGMLPEAWRDPVVPWIVTEAQAIATTLLRYPAATVGPRQIDVIQDAGNWRAAWLITLYGSFPDTCPLASPFPSDCPPATAVDVRVDAVTGDFISTEVNAP
jgi:hypothetical protein